MMREKVKNKRKDGEREKTESGERETSRSEVGWTQDR